MDPRPYQPFAVDGINERIVRGVRRLLASAPTGTGKTWIICRLVEGWSELGMKTAVYTNRKLLVEQTSRVMEAAGIGHGRRAAGYWEGELSRQVQICSVQTEGARVLRSGRWDLHDADRVIVDEAHIQTGPTVRKILDRHYEEGAAIVGFTATPVGLGGLYDELFQICSVSDGRACGALLKAMHYGPDEPDLKHIGKVPLGEDLTEKQAVKAIMVPGIFGRVFEWYERLNPERKPAILFAPGVKESVWFAEQFAANGVRAAHIDGESVWLDGQFYKSDRAARDDVLAGSKAGLIKVICNRFVLREGVDAPWLYHGIFATVFGSLATYLQSVGRLLRSYPGLDHVVIQDHGGNWWRHGSVNVDRFWQLDHTPGMVSGLREERLREKKEPEPARCPKCGMIISRPACPCGWEMKYGQKSRPVVQADGSLKEMRGDVFKPRRITNKPDADRIWERMYHRAKRADMTFRQAEALFAVENNWGYPPRTLPLMPVDPLDWFKKVTDVPPEKLRGKP